MENLIKLNITTLEALKKLGIKELNINNIGNVLDTIDLYISQVINLHNEKPIDLDFLNQLDQAHLDLQSLNKEAIDYNYANNYLK